MAGEEAVRRCCTHRTRPEPVHELFHAVKAQHHLAARRHSHVEARGLQALKSQQHQRVADGGVLVPLRGGEAAVQRVHAGLRTACIDRLVASDEVAHALARHRPEPAQRRTAARRRRSVLGLLAVLGVGEVQELLEERRLLLGVRHLLEALDDGRRECVVLVRKALTIVLVHVRIRQVAEEVRRSKSRGDRVACALPQESCELVPAGRDRPEEAVDVAERLPLCVVVEPPVVLLPQRPRLRAGDRQNIHAPRPRQIALGPRLWIHPIREGCLRPALGEQRVPATEQLGAGEHAWRCERQCCRDNIVRKVVRARRRALGRAEQLGPGHRAVLKEMKVDLVVPLQVLPRPVPVLLPSHRLWEVGRDPLVVLQPPPLLLSATPPGRRLGEVGAREEGGALRLRERIRPQLAQDQPVQRVLLDAKVQQVPNRLGLVVVGGVEHRPSVGQPLRGRAVLQPHRDSAAGEQLTDRIHRVVLESERDLDARVDDGGVHQRSDHDVEQIVAASRLVELEEVQARIGNDVVQQGDEAASAAAHGAAKALDLAVGEDGT